MLAVESIEVGAKRIQARIRVDAPGALTTRAWPGMAQRLWALLPGLERHSCDNDTGASFRQELADTEIAHCVEHVAAELMALSGSPRTLRAETSWDFEADGHGVYRVTFDYDDDLAALGALKEAVVLVEWAASPSGDAPDAEKIASRLRQLRLTGS